MSVPCRSRPSRGSPTAPGSTCTAGSSRSRAAAGLLATDRPVAVIAADHGFAGHEVFTRAFARRFGVPPRAYRARGSHVADDRAVAAGLPQTYRAMEAWVLEQGRSPAGAPMEVYLTDPGEHPDPRTGETEVVLPLA